MFNHAYDIGFEIISEHSAEDVTADELWIGLNRRVQDLRGNPKEILEACGLPFDTYEFERGKHGD